MSTRARFINAAHLRHRGVTGSVGNQVSNVSRCPVRLESGVVVKYLCSSPLILEAVYLGRRVSGGKHVRAGNSVISLPRSYLNIRTRGV